MSNTYRNNRIRPRTYRYFGESYMDWEKGKWVRLPPSGKGDSKPWKERHRSKDVGKFKTWRCRCEDYCIRGKLHKHLKKPTIHWELTQV